MFAPGLAPIGTLYYVSEVTIFVHSQWGKRPYILVPLATMVVFDTVHHDRLHIWYSFCVWK